jgi:hypothetical protein
LRATYTTTRTAIATTMASAHQSTANSPDIRVEC